MVDRGHIVAELVELADRVMDGMEVEVRRNVVGILVVGRVLHGAEIVDLIPLRYDNHAAGMLARGALDAGAADGQPLFLRTVQRDAAFLRVFLHEANGSLVRHGGNGAGLEHVVLAEERLRVAVGAALVFAGKVQVDIRRLVAVEAEERLKGDIVAVSVVIGTTLRAFLRRQVKAGAVAAVRDKFAVLAIGADVVRHKGIDLRNAGHAGHERRTDGAARADQIAVFLAVGNQLLRRHVQHGKAVLVDGAELALEPLLHDLRQGIAVNFFCALPADAVELLLRAVDERREHALRDGAHLLDEIRDPVGVRHHNLVCLLLAEIGKLLQHFRRGAEIERRLVVCVAVALAGHEDAAVIGILRVHEVHVARGDNRLAELFAQADDRAVEFTQLFLILDLAIADHKRVVADRLDLQVIVKFRDAAQLRPGRAVEHGAEQLARLAGAAKQEPFAVLHERAFEDARLFEERFQV